MMCLGLMYFGLKMFFMTKKHIIMMLLSLEFLVLIVLLMLTNMMSLFSYDCSLIIYIIIIFVCEAVMGLLLLTLFVRSHGSDYMKGSSLFLC